MDREVTPEQAAFVEAKTKEFFDYTIQCFDKARSEGTNILQWLFAVITTGMAGASTLESKGYLPFAIGAISAVIAAAHAAMKLITSLQTRETMPPGNLAENLNAMLDEPIHRMKWREAKGMDGRIQHNLKEVESLAAAVDKARLRFANIPFIFISGTLAGYAYLFLFK